MAGFKTHISTSTLLGAGYGAAGLALGAPLPSCCLAAGLCSIAGMLPDLDSDSGVPIRESFAFLAAVIPMLMVHRFEQLGLDHEAMVLSAGLIYIAVRFGVGEIFKRYTVHRGMWHSFPACASAGLLAFLVCSSSDMAVRLFLSCAVVVGFLSHLALDEIYSVDWQGRQFRLKRSFGTAMKFWSKRSLWANISTYGKLVLLVALAIGDPVIMDQIRLHRSSGPELVESARTATAKSKSWWDDLKNRVSKENVTR